jgi:predicted RNA-binding Zn ribbon-like protein
VVAQAHPVDSTGLVLPDGSWPDSRGIAGPLERVRRFCNTVNRENGADAWRSTSELDAWLAREGYRVRPTRAVDLRRAKVVREAIWESVRSGTREPVAAAAPQVRVCCEATSGTIHLVAAGDTVEAVVAELVLHICEADRAGTFGRLKSCDHCRWVFYDTSKNRTGRWCSMQACGGREKAKAYRRRRSGDHRAPGTGRAPGRTGRTEAVR